MVKVPKEMSSVIQNRRTEVENFYFSFGVRNVLFCLFVRAKYRGMDVIMRGRAKPVSTAGLCFGGVWPTVQSLSSECE